MAKRGRKTSYESYLEQYQKEAAKILKKGGKVNDVPFSKMEFEMAHAELVADRRRDVEAGRRKTIGNLTRTLVKEQVETFSLSRAKAIKKALELQGQSATLSDIRYGIKSTSSLWSDIDERREELERTLPDNAQKEGIIKRRIAVEFFGSK